MKKSWLRFLNPFHFEPRSVFWMAWANAIIALMLSPLVFFALFYLRPQAAHLANLTAAAETRLGKTADANQLRERLTIQWNNDHGVWLSLFHVWGAIAFLFATIVCLCLCNAVYQFKAFKLLTASQPDS